MNKTNLLHMLKKIIVLTGTILFATFTNAQSQKVSVKKSTDGFKLEVNGNSFFINGMNWDYFPIGTNYNYSLWKQSDEVIIKALNNEMGMLKSMGVNSIRQYYGIPPRWIKYIYEKYGIYTILNHSFGRYGVNVNGAWQANTDYGNAKVQEQLLKEVQQMVNETKDTPGLLLYLLGNENNYGLFWQGAETEDIPFEKRKSTKEAHNLYQLFNKAALTIKNSDANHPVSLCNGDLLFIDLMASECKDVDIIGTNMYRGMTFTNAFEEVKNKLNKPLFITEFGSDAYNAISNNEDQQPQAEYLVSNWKDIYQNAAGMGKTGVAIGGCTFQFSDGWWKYKLDTNLDVHDANASWSNGGYAFDFHKGENNMNEEWFGICAKGKPDDKGLYSLYPRTAYYVLKQMHKFDPTISDNAELNKTVSNISFSEAAFNSKVERMAAQTDNQSGMLRLSRLTADFTTFNTGGELIKLQNKPLQTIQVIQIN